MLSGASLKDEAMYILNPLVSTIHKWIQVCRVVHSIVQSLCGSVRQCAAIDSHVSTLFHRYTLENGSDFVTVR
jgi:hypothetical protein